MSLFSCTFSTSVHHYVCKHCSQETNLIGTVLTDFFCFYFSVLEIFHYGIFDCAPSVSDFRLH